MSKYIIKNCPAFSLEPTKAGNVCKKWCSSKPCQHYTDCPLKQIVKKCKRVDCDCLIDKRKCGAMDSMSTCCELFTKKDILKDLEIEEVN